MVPTLEHRTVQTAAQAVQTAAQAVQTAAQAAARSAVQTAVRSAVQKAVRSAAQTAVLEDPAGSWRGPCRACRPVPSWCAGSAVPGPPRLGRHGRPAGSPPAADGWPTAETPGGHSGSYMEDPTAGPSEAPSVSSARLVVSLCSISPQQKRVNNGAHSHQVA